MSLNSLSSEKKSKMSLIELTRLMMLEEKKEMKFKDAFNRAADLKGLSKDGRGGKIAQYYTDLNVDGNFVTSGANMWGLKSWYQDKVQDEEEASIPRKVKRKRRKKREDDDLVKEFAMIDSHIDEVSDEYIEEDDLDLELDGEFEEDFEDDTED